MLNVNAIHALQILAKNPLPVESKENLEAAAQWNNIGVSLPSNTRKVCRVGDEEKCVTRFDCFARAVELSGGACIFAVINAAMEEAEMSQNYDDFYHFCQELLTAENISLDFQTQLESLQQLRRTGKEQNIRQTEVAIAILVTLAKLEAASPQPYGLPSPLESAILAVWWAPNNPQTWFALSDAIRNSTPQEHQQQEFMLPLKTTFSEICCAQRAVECEEATAPMWVRLASLLGPYQSITLATPATYPPRTPQKFDQMRCLMLALTTSQCTSGDAFYNIGVSLLIRKVPSVNVVSLNADLTAKHCFVLALIHGCARSSDAWFALAKLIEPSESIRLTASACITKVTSGLRFLCELNRSFESEISNQAADVWRMLLEWTEENCGGHQHLPQKPLSASIGEDLGTWFRCEAEGHCFPGEIIRRKKISVLDCRLGLLYTEPFNAEYWLELGNALLQGPFGAVTLPHGFLDVDDSIFLAADCFQRGLELHEMSSHQSPSLLARFWLGLGNCNEFSQGNASTMLYRGKEVTPDECLVKAIQVAPNDPTAWEGLAPLFHDLETSSVETPNQPDFGTPTRRRSRLPTAVIDVPGMPIEPLTLADWLGRILFLDPFNEMALLTVANQASSLSVGSIVRVQLFDNDWEPAGSRSFTGAEAATACLEKHPRNGDAWQFLGSSLGAGETTAVGNVVVSRTDAFYNCAVEHNDPSSWKRLAVELTRFRNTKVSNVRVTAEECTAKAEALEMAMLHTKTRTEAIELQLLHCFKLVYFTLWGDYARWRRQYRDHEVL